ncbi:tatD related DNase [Leucosporidium creatinivorum]|uniref:TatD related DNase n=1 Tax=Leucosporidium creatinivorum TaxID=106004 RepID=A0A1Y2FVQ8_9BASI|nr:tatD related DNase [Leucosporidium creatinivorum]
MAAPSPPKLIDIGSNLGDPVFRGSYHGKQAHSDDFLDILERARAAGVGTQLLTGDCLSGSKEVIALAKEHAGLYATTGCHPCRAQEFDTFPGGPDAYLEALAKVIEENKGPEGRVLAVGECGLDYDRLHLCPKDVQLKHFPPQLELASRFNLPLFLHSRAAHRDFVDIIKAHVKPLRGVVHSHSESLEQALECIQLGFYIGINCSLKTPENVECVRQLPLDKIMIESDCPWCEIRPSHASHPHLSTITSSITHSHLEPLYIPPSVKKERWTSGKGVKGRNEPCSTGQVAWVVSQLKGVSVEEVAEQTYRNTCELFGIPE